jgi:hypothetical protein
MPWCPRQPGVAFPLITGEGSMVAWARARREGCGSWRTPAAGWNAGCPEACRGAVHHHRRPPGGLRALLDEACTGRDQACRERFAGRQAHERASAQVARLQRQVNEITSQLGGVPPLIRCPGWEPSPACRGERRRPVRFVEPPWRPALRQALPVLLLAATSPHPMAGSSRRCCAPMASGTW